MQTCMNSSEMHFLSEQFVNEQIKHLLGEEFEPCQNQLKQKLCSHDSHF